MIAKGNGKGIDMKNDRTIMKHSVQTTYARSS